MALNVALSRAGTREWGDGMARAAAGGASRKDKIRVAAALPAVPAWYFNARWRTGRNTSGVSKRRRSAVLNGIKPCMRRRLSSNATKAVVAVVAQSNISEV